jgi:hypothetical protein
METMICVFIFIYGLSLAIHLEDYYYGGVNDAKSKVTEGREI